MSDAVLELDQIVCGYQDAPVVREVSFRLAQGDIACLLGPSGCGKTTTLRAIAGLEPLLGGRLRIHGRDASRPGFMLPPEQRRLGMMFQDHALFPHLTVAQNIAFGLRHLDRSARQERIREGLALVRLPDLGDRYPHELSGGQQQRVALARALAPRPPLILLDEPFASLDLDLRRQLNQELRTILEAARVTAVIVTHDQEEAFAIASQVGILRDGRLEQWDTPYNIYHAPATRFVAEFAGAGSFVPGRVIAGNRVATALGELWSEQPLGRPEGERVQVLLRPEDLALDPASCLSAQVVHRLFAGPTIQYRLALPDGQQVLCQASSHRNHEVGSTVTLRTQVKHLVLFPA